MNALLCALSLSLVPSDQPPPGSLADKNAELERKVADLERKVYELRIAELERKVTELSAPQTSSSPRVQLVLLPPPLAPVVVSPVVTTVSVQVYQGGGYGGYGVGGYGGYGGYGYVAPRYTTFAPRPLVNTLPVTTHHHTNVVRAAHHHR